MFKMGGAKSMDPKDLATGGLLQCIEAATLGMPFEVWKTRMGRYRNESTVQAFRAVYERGGGGMKGVRVANRSETRRLRR